MRNAIVGWLVRNIISSFDCSFFSGGVGSNGSFSLVDMLLNVQCVDVAALAFLHLH